MKDTILKVLEKYQGIDYDETAQFALASEIEAEINAFLSREQAGLIAGAVKSEPASPQENPPFCHANDKSS
jgi:hypothetical protein